MVKTAKEAGFKYLILITKHHDGFCLWDSKYTDYDVASSSVKTNVVKAVADACKKYGLQLGLYYLLWNRHEPIYYLPFEHTICLSERSNWFQKKQFMPTLSVDELEQLFYWCTANENILIINVPPDQHGQIRANERETLLALADRLMIKGGIKKETHHRPEYFIQSTSTLFGNKTRHD